MIHIKDYDEFKRTSTFFTLKPSNANFVFLITICISFIALFIWAFFAPMNEVVHADVILRPKENISSIRCATSGEILQKRYENNTIVEKDDLLLQLDTSSLLKEKEEFERKLIKIENDIQVAKVLLKTIDIQEFPPYPTESQEYITSASYLSERKRRELIVESAKRNLDYEESLPSFEKVPMRILDCKNEYDRCVADFDSWKNSTKLQANTNFQNLNTTKDTIQTTLTEIKRNIRNANIYAPISGKVFEVKKVNKGDYIFSTEEIIRIIPDEENLLAEIYIQTSDIAKVKIGNDVKIKFSSLPPSRYGQLETKVTLIPADSILQNGIPFFITEALIEEPFLYEKTIKHNDVKIRLISGITGQARITTDTSTVLQMVLKKLDFLR